MSSPKTQKSRAIQITNNLIAYLEETYGSEVIKLSPKNPDKDNDVLVNGKYINDITDNGFNNFIRTSKYIKLNSLINYLTDNANTNNTRGKYHELMDMIHAMYNVEIIDGLPNYSVLDIDIKIKINPKRIEFLICWWIQNKIKNDPFMSNYLYVNGERLALPEYQKTIKSIDERYYDMIFELLNIVVEIQEDNNAHKNNQNDILKEALARVRSKRIVYFKLVNYNQDKYEYLNEFWNDILRPMLIQGLLAYNREIRSNYCIYTFKENMRLEYSNNKKEIHVINQLLKNKNITSNQTQKFNDSIQKLTIRQKYIKPFFDSNNSNSLISTLFEWKEIENKSNNKNIISISNIIDLNTINDIEFKDFEKIIKNKYLYEKRNNIIYISWKTLIKIIFSLDMINQTNKERILDYLLIVPDIYEDIIKKILNHTEERFNNSDDMDELVNNHIIQKHIEHYEPTIDNYKHKIDVLQEEQKITNKKIKKHINIFTKACNIIKEKAKLKRDIKLVNDIDECIKSLNEIHHENIGKYITFQKLLNRSIIKEIDNFPIIYTYNCEDTIPIAEFEAICHDYKISESNIRMLYNSLLNNNSNQSGKPLYVPYICHIDNLNSEIESYTYNSTDSESNMNSDIDSDSESDSDTDNIDSEALKLISNKYGIDSESDNDN